jgi:hypothetical protein
MHRTPRASRAKLRQARKRAHLEQSRPSDFCFRLYAWWQQDFATAGAALVPPCAAAYGAIDWGGGGARALVPEEVDGPTMSIVHEPQRVWPLRRGEEEEQHERLEGMEERE